MTLNTHPKVAAVFASYPDTIREKMCFLRDLIIETATETPKITTLEETLKWGEPSFITKQGSTLRMDWKKHSPDQYALYFQCNSSLVTTFRMVFGQQFKYQGERAILFSVDQKIPVNEVKKCIQAALLYHQVKHLKFLGIVD
ncbi:DUF1801 domain-containing protein [Flavobacterium crassostreae]|uniref:YdhG-like domain-containing protein n=1 Tax=Flavobacterium crassostreae TaxID=1763534 RepID=A0A1B9E9Y7_9FLAO|nr:DUF1801 domain-containing protein [Flavobacterium crassostreae]OCB78774.1 hypothetical protein LPBF_01930 [Flavobacterium crassostreae]